MEIEGHPTEDLIEELERRGAVRIAGSAAGPDPDALRFVTDRVGSTGGYWLYLPYETFMTGMDDVPG
jgi:hypothetical protein